MNKIDILKREEIEILNYVVDICEKNNLKYHLDFGTLLGAVRHKGFIPWDDDIDISMPRCDYDKFIKICALMNSNSDFFLQTSDTDSNYYQFFAKMRKNNTTFLEKDAEYLKYNKGIYIDIFPVDSTPEIGIMFKIKFSLSVIINKFCVLVKNPFPYLPLFFAKIVYLFFYPCKARYFNKIIYLLIKNTEENNFYFCLDNGMNFNAIFDKDILRERIDHEFEGKKYKIPLSFDIYLTALYGDYLKLPPLYLRTNPHTAIIIDSEKGYDYYDK